MAEEVYVAVEEGVIPALERNWGVQLALWPRTGRKQGEVYRVTVKRLEKIDGLLEEGDDFLLRCVRGITFGI